MKRLINKAETIVEDMINGYVKINRGFIKKYQESMLL